MNNTSKNNQAPLPDNQVGGTIRHDKKLWCGYCGWQITNISASFCPKCGNPISRNQTQQTDSHVANQCANCGRTISLEAQFCPGCGQPIQRPITNPSIPTYTTKVRKSPRIAIIVTSVIVLCLLGGAVLANRIDVARKETESKKGISGNSVDVATENNDVYFTGTTTRSIQDTENETGELDGAYTFDERRNMADAPETLPESDDKQRPALMIGGNPIDIEDSAMNDMIRGRFELYDEDPVTDRMCEEITELDFSGYTLNTLADLKFFPNLTTLYVDNNGQTLDLKGINKAANLRSLTLMNCGLSEVDRIASLEQLEYLNISTDSSWGTNVKDYSLLAGLKNLKTLNMEWRGYNAYNPYALEDGSFISSLTSLEELNIKYTGIENYDLSRLGNLKKLIIRECTVDEILGQICESGAIHGLEYLDIGLGSYNKTITDDGLKYLAQAGNMRHLEIDVAALTTLKGMGQLGQLEYLKIINRVAFQLPLDAYRELANLKNVTELSFDDNAPNVKDKLDDVELTPDDYSFLSDMTALKKARLIAYDGMSIGSFSNLDQLECLILWDGNIYYDEEVDISDIAAFKSLKEVYYAGIRFKSSAPLDELNNLTVKEESIYDI